MKYDTVIYCFYSAKKGIDFGKSLFVLEGILYMTDVTGGGHVHAVIIRSCLRVVFAQTGLSLH